MKEKPPESFTTIVVHSRIVLSSELPPGSGAVDPHMEVLLPSEDELIQVDQQSQHGIESVCRDPFDDPEELSTDITRRQNSRYKQRLSRQMDIENW